MVEIKLGLKTVDLPYTLRLHGVTEELFDELVDEDVKAELFDGVMIVHSPATMEHDDIGGFTRTLMRCYANVKKAGKVFGPDSLIRLKTGRKFGPDIFFIAQARMPKRRPKQWKGTPDAVTEILSPSNRADDLRDKLPAYQEAGVGEIWFIDPKYRQVIIYRKRGLRYVKEVVSAGKARSTVLDSFWVEVSWLWSDPLPGALECLQAILDTAER